MNFTLIKIELDFRDCDNYKLFVSFNISQLKDTIFYTSFILSLKLLIFVSDVIKISVRLNFSGAEGAQSSKSELCQDNSIHLCHVRMTPPKCRSSKFTFWPVIERANIFAGPHHIDN